MFSLSGCKSAILSLRVSLAAHSNKMIALRLFFLVINTIRFNKFTLEVLVLKIKTEHCRMAEEVAHYGSFIKTPLLPTPSVCENIFGTTLLHCRRVLGLLNWIRSGAEYSNKSFNQISYFNIQNTTHHKNCIDNNHHW